MSIRPVTIVEIDLDWVLGSVLPVNPDGSLCYQTPATTSGTVQAGVRTRRFCSHTTAQVWALDAIPCLRDIRVEAAQLQVGTALGSFGQVTVTLDDFADDDRQEDPFWTQRTHDRAAGTYFGKLSARNPYVQGRALRVLTGQFDGVTTAITEIRHFLIRALTRTGRSTWQLTGVSPLQLLNLGKVQAPRALGWRLAAGLPGWSGSAALADWTIQADHPTSGVCRIGEELCAFTRSGATLALARGQYGTSISDHESDEAVQPALVFSNATVTEILRTLLVDHARVDPAMIPFASWQAEADAWLAQYRLSPLPIVEGVDVTALITELCTQIGLLLWYDERTRTIRLQTLRPVPSSRVAHLNDDDLLSEVSITPDVAQRISQVVVLFGKRQAIGGADGESGYRRRLLGVAEGDGPLAHGSAAISVVESRWFAVQDDALAARTAATLVAQRKDGRTRLGFTVHRDRADLDLGSVVLLTTRDLMDVTGAPKPTYAIITSRTPTRDGRGIDLQAEPFPYVTRYAYVLPSGFGPYGSTPTALREPAWFLSASDGRLPNGEPGYALG